MKKTTFWLVFGVILIVIFIVWRSMHKADLKTTAGFKGGKQPVKVDAMVVKPSLLIDEISVSGSILANDEVELHSEVAGRVVQLNLPEGKFVKAGTLLVKLFDDDLQANLKKLQTQLAIQEEIHKRQAELLNVNGISQNDYDQTRLQLDELKADIEVEKALIRKTEVLAPFDGVIGLRNISIGAQVTSTTLLATIRSDIKLKLDFSVPEKYSPKIRPGMAVKFSMYNEEKYYDATVIATEQGIDANTRNLRVRAIINTSSGELLPGAYANVELQLGSNNKALVIPSKAIIPKAKNKLVIRAKNGEASFIQVKTGIRNETGVEITNGLSAGDTIITTGIMMLKEGSKLVYSSVVSDTL